MTVSLSTVMFSFLPVSPVFAVRPFSDATSEATAFAIITWYISRSTSFCLLSGLSRLSRVPAGSAAKAASVGASRVNGPTPLRVSASPAASIAATSFVKCPVWLAVATMSISPAGASLAPAAAALCPSAGAPAIKLLPSGIRTPLISWITPLVVMISAIVTATVVFSIILSCSTATVICLPSKPVLVEFPFKPEMSAAMALAVITWYISRLMSSALFSGMSSAASVSGGSAANAASVGASKVMGPAALRASTKPAASTALMSVVKWPA